LEDFSDNPETSQCSVQIEDENINACPREEACPLDLPVLRNRPSLFLARPPPVEKINAEKQRKQHLSQKMEYAMSKPSLATELRCQMNGASDRARTGDLRRDRPTL
jgi:hypothetical protein